MTQGFRNSRVLTLLPFPKERRIYMKHFSSFNSSSNDLNQRSRQRSARDTCHELLFPCFCHSSSNSSFDISLPENSGSELISLKLFGTNIVGARMTNLAVSMLTIFMVYLLLKRLFSKDIAVLTTLFLAINPGYIRWGVYAFPDMLAGFFGIVSILLLIIYLKEAHITLRDTHKDENRLVQVPQFL